jgi:hypothetical protein
MPRSLSVAIKRPWSTAFWYQLTTSTMSRSCLSSRSPNFACNTCSRATSAADRALSSEREGPSRLRLARAPLSVCQSSPHTEAQCAEELAHQRDTHLVRVRCVYCYYVLRRSSQRAAATCIPLFAKPISRLHCTAISIYLFFSARARALSLSLQTRPKPGIAVHANPNTALSLCLSAHSPPPPAHTHTHTHSHAHTHTHIRTHTHTHVHGHSIFFFTDALLLLSCVFPSCRPNAA